MKKESKVLLIHGIVLLMFFLSLLINNYSTSIALMIYGSCLFFEISLAFDYTIFLIKEVKQNETNKKRIIGTEKKSVD